MTTTAPKPATAKELYAEGMSLLGSGDTLGASEKLWAAAATAMEAYAKVRGWVPDDRRYYEDTVACRIAELGLVIGDPIADERVYFPFTAALMFAENVIEEGSLLSERAARVNAELVRKLLTVFSISASTNRA